YRQYRGACGTFGGGSDPDPFLQRLSYLYAGIPSGIYLSGRPRREDPYAASGQSKAQDQRGKRGDRRLTDRDLSAGFSGRLAADGNDGGENLRSQQRGADPGGGRRLYPLCSGGRGGIQTY